MYRIGGVVPRIGFGTGVALVLAAFAVWVSADGGDPTLIHACVKPSSGEVKIVGATATCKPGWTPLHWRAAAAGAANGSGFLHARSNFAASGAKTTQFAMFVEEGTESFVQVPVPRAGTLANLHVRPHAAPAGGAIVGVTVRVNNADTTLNVTHTSADGTSTKSNTAAAVTVNRGDLVAVRFTESGGVVPAAVYRATFELR
jgi:hypothetical protein